MAYARIQNNAVAEICNIPAGFTIEQCFHPSLVAQMVLCGDDVQAGWAYVDGSFIAPEAPTTEEPTAEAPTSEAPPTDEPASETPATDEPSA